MELSKDELDYLYDALLAARNSAASDLERVRVYRPYLVKSHAEALAVYEKLVFRVKQELGLSNG